MISSQLASQLFSKDITWQILISRYPTRIWRRTPPPELRIEVWARCVYVHLPATDYRVGGFSLFLSYWDYIKEFGLKTEIKAYHLNVLQVRETIFSVSSSQGQTAERHTVNVSQFGISCSCMLYKCLRNRIVENTYLRDLLKKEPFFSGQIVCHHIYRIIGKLGFYDMADYLDSKKTCK